MGGGVYTNPAVSRGLFRFHRQRRSFYYHKYIGRREVRPGIYQERPARFNRDGRMFDFSLSVCFYNVENERGYAKNHDDAYNVAYVDEFSPAYSRVSVNA